MFLPLVACLVWPTPSPGYIFAQRDECSLSNQAVIWHKPLLPAACCLPSNIDRPSNLLSSLVGVNVGVFGFCERPIAPEAAAAWAANAAAAAPAAADVDILRVDPPHSSCCPASAVHILRRVNNTTTFNHSRCSGCCWPWLGNHSATMSSQND